MVFDRSARIAAVSQKEHEQIYPKPGWVEHDALEILRRTEEVVAEALSQRGLRASDLAAIGITNQRETTIVWERKTGKPIANAIVWQDRRTTDFCHELKEKWYEPLFKQKTGLLLDPYFSGTKLHWILSRIP